MNTNGDILIIKDKNEKLLSFNGQGNTIEINKKNLTSIRLFNNEDEVSNFLKSTLGSFKEGNDALVIKFSSDELTSEVEKIGTKSLTVKNLDPGWLSNHVIDLKTYLPEKLNEKQGESEIVNNKNVGYHSIDEKKVDKVMVLQEWGINLDSLKESGDFDRMLNYGRSRLLTCYPIIAGVCFPMQAKLSFREKTDGSVAVIPHPIRREANLTQYRGYELTDNDRLNLLTTGNLGHTIEIDSHIYGQKMEAYLSLDKETNELVSISKNSIKIPPIIKGVELSAEQRQKLESGESVLVKGMRSARGEIFDAKIQISAERRSIVFKTTSDKMIIGDKILGKDITSDIKKDWDNGKWVYLENMIAKDGKPFSAYVRPNMEKGRFEFSRSNPEDHKTVTENCINKTKQALNFLKELEEERKSGINVMDENGKPKHGTKTAQADAMLERYSREKYLHVK